ncbi:MAG: hypothetical protein RLY43_2494 [Bacteroidota bacterium]|jgi:hypothetical protein
MKKQIEDSIYSIDIHGIVKNEKTNKIISKSINQKGYERFNVWINGKSRSFKTHRLLAILFIPNPNNFLSVNHKDGDKLNNQLENLEWCTLSYNTKHAYSLGLISQKKKFSKEIELEIAQLYNQGYSQYKLAKEYNTSQQMICNIIKRNRPVGQSNE